LVHYRFYAHRPTVFSNLFAKGLPAQSGPLGSEPATISFPRYAIEDCYSVQAEVRAQYISKGPILYNLLNAID